VVAMELFLLAQAHRARKAELTVRRPGVRIAPISRTWAFCQTRLENSGTNGAKSRIILAGGVRTSITSSLADCGDESVPYPFSSQIAKVELERAFSEIRHLAYGRYATWQMRHPQANHKVSPLPH
jgi:hypothetical protein